MVVVVDACNDDVAVIASCVTSCSRPVSSPVHSTQLTAAFVLGR